MQEERLRKNWELSLLIRTAGQSEKMRIKTIGIGFVLAVFSAMVGFFILGPKILNEGNRHPYREERRLSGSEKEESREEKGYTLELRCRNLHCGEGHTGELFCSITYDRKDPFRRGDSDQNEGLWFVPPGGMTGETMVIKGTTHNGQVGTFNVVKDYELAHKMYIKYEPASIEIICGKKPGFCSNDIVYTARAEKDPLLIEILCKGRIGYCNNENQIPCMIHTAGESSPFGSKHYAINYTKEGKAFIEEVPAYILYGD